jgi:hypothetical protein
MYLSGKKYLSKYSGYKLTITEKDGKAVDGVDPSKVNYVIMEV